MLSNSSFMYEKSQGSYSDEFTCTSGIAMMLSRMQHISSASNSPGEDIRTCSFSGRSDWNLGMIVKELDSPTCKRGEVIIVTIMSNNTRLLLVLLITGGL
eukprot:TRINITY_DN68104_c0_g1_i2.p3 TRINITY_DN68104_c0_g1~~TRINITY_DN68104_c0_g1_i2.p3  ORF type:complete len:100 (-),score=12.93 TRINITY_DN68104_c0_g1_i2:868-1167(-)